MLAVFLENSFHISVRVVQRGLAAAVHHTSAMVRRTLACALLLSCELCRVHGEDNDGPRKNDTTWTRAVIGGIVLVVIVMMMVVGVLVMAAKEEDGRALTKVLSLQSSADGKSAGQDDASQGSQAAEPRPAS